LIEILRITGAFGIKGALRAFSFSENLSRYQQIYDKNGNAFSFRILRYLVGGKIVISIDGINDRDKAESLKNEIFFLKKSDLPSVEKDEVYVCDLIGKEVYVIGSDIKCHVSNVENYGAGDLIEISCGDEKFLVPFTHDNFPENLKETEMAIEREQTGISMTFEAFNRFRNQQ
jgi:16S rRNA processing protein RimM